MWPEVKRDGVFYPRETRLRNICRQALEDVMFSKDKHSFSLSHTKTLCCERTSLKAWLLFHLNSVAHVPLPTPWFFPSSCVKQVSHLDTKQFAPCSPSLPKSVFTPVSVPLKREEISDQICLHQSGIRPSTLKVILCLCLPICAFVQVHLDASKQMNIHQHHYTELKMNRETVFSQSINQQLIVINPRGCAPAAEQRALNRPNAEF